MKSRRLKWMVLMFKMLRRPMRRTKTLQRCLISFRRFRVLTSWFRTVILMRNYLIRSRAFTRKKAMGFSPINYYAIYWQLTDQQLGNFLKKSRLKFLQKRCLSSISWFLKTRSKRESSNWVNKSMALCIYSTVLHWRIGTAFWEMA